MAELGVDNPPGVARRPLHRFAVPLSNFVGEEKRWAAFCAFFPAFRGEVADPGLEPGEGRWGDAGGGVVTGLGADSPPGLARRPLHPPSPFGLRPVLLPIAWGGKCSGAYPAF